MTSRHLVAWWDRHQIVLYLAAILAGLATGLLLPGADRLEPVINPTIALVLLATFLAVPLARIGTALRDLRFLAALALVNFLVAPVVAFGLSRFVVGDPALEIGVLIVLLTPCVDYVIVFAALAGAAHERLLAAAPLLMLAQLVLLPVYLVLILGPGVGDVVEVEPFLEAFLVLIALPLAVAALIQRLARRHRPAHRVMRLMQSGMVPLMMITLAVVVASQARAVGGQVTALAGVVPLFVVFLVVMAVVGVAASRLARLDVAASRALTFSGATRNSLVVLPLGLALPAPLSLVPLVIVTQTLVELIGMVVYVRLIPRLIPARSDDG